MNTLIIYDSSATSAKIWKMSISEKEIFYLFPLTSKSGVTNAVAEELNKVGCDFYILNTAEIIALAADNLRDSYIQFTATFVDRIKEKGIDIKKLFAVDEYATLWWFGLITEKHPYKSTAFNKIAQLDSIIASVKDKDISRIVFRSRDNVLKEALAGYARSMHVKFEAPPESIGSAFRNWILKFQKVYYLRHIFMLLNFVVRYSLRIWRIKKSMAGLNRRPFSLNGALLSITPYPNIDLSLAREGKFKNRFYGELQDALEINGKTIIWVAMYVENHSLSFRESLRYARGFINKGYLIFFLEEFSSMNIQIRSLYMMFKAGLRYLTIEKKIAPVHNARGYNFYEALKEDWYLSFAGIAGYLGLLYYYSFKSMLDNVRADKCLYLCEMHAWEKALLSAKRALGLSMPFYGYQSGTVSRMLLNYFNGHGEINDTGFYAIPQPEKIVCNGSLPYSYLKESGWPEDKLVMAEAVRYSHLKKAVMSKMDDKKNIALLAFSISAEESSSILNLVYEAFKDLHNMEIWIKPHPFLRIEKVFELSGIPMDPTFFKIKKLPAEELFFKARIVIAGQSGVAVEALAYGCEILLINTPEWINISSLKDMLSNTIRLVNSSQELRQAIIEIFKKEYDPVKHMHCKRDIIDRCFYLNYDSDIPDRFLKLLKEN